MSLVDTITTLIRDCERYAVRSQSFKVKPGSYDEALAADTVRLAAAISYAGQELNVPTEEVSGLVGMTADALAMAVRGNYRESEVIYRCVHQALETLRKAYNQPAPDNVPPSVYGENEDKG